jgi:uroporphyrinogen decarboxylase
MVQWGRNWLESPELLGVVRRKSSGVVPSIVAINYAVWDKDRDYFEALIKRTPDVLISTAQDAARATERKERDAWGCLWHYPGSYLDGQVISHPLDDWDKLQEYEVPDPGDFIDWEQAREDIEKSRREGKLTRGYVEHGFLYLRLTYLRGFENFMLDVAEERPELYILRDIVAHYWDEVVLRWLDIGVDIVQFADDLGHQASLPIHPDSWRKLILPAYEKSFAACREKSVEVFLHTDGYIVDIIPDLIKAGMTVLNPQDLINGLETVKRLAWGKVGIFLDVDRQKVTAFGTPGEIEEHIADCIRTLGSPQGGLMLVYGAYPGMPAENVGAVIRAMQKYHDYWV